MPFVVTPKLLLPKKDIDYTRWAVIACDQFTSEPQYWLELKMLVDNHFSTYKLILPEVFLNHSVEQQIRDANRNMEDYLRINLFEEHECMILVDRKTPYRPSRKGLVLAIDLENYEFEEGKISSIVASEKTVAERIPPRVRIRENAPIELSHVLVLIDDQNSRIIEKLYEQKDEMEVLYDFDLNMGGGHLKGYKVENNEKIIHKLMASQEAIKMVVGDGNHSLASAKVFWDHIKKTLPENEYFNHPARYAMVEVVSLYDPGLTFEPIHRVIYDAPHDFVKLLNKFVKGDARLNVFDKKKIFEATVSSNPFVAIKDIQNFLDHLMLQTRHMHIDYVHGMDSLRKIVSEHKNAIGIEMPPLRREDLFPYVRQFGALPRKSFSLGEAREKRYYMECRKIIK